MRGEELPVLDEQMESMDPDENENCKFLGVQQADEIKTEVVFERVKRVKMLLKTKLNDTSLISAINVKVIPVVAYLMNLCKFSKEELDQIIKR